MAPRKPVDQSATKPRGRPSTGVLRTQVRLRPEDIERARALGGGNVSAGIRLALSVAIGLAPKQAAGT